MNIEKGFHRLLLLLGIVSAFLCLPAQIHAASSDQVKYNASKKGYYLYTSPQKTAEREGLYAINKKKVKGRTFDGIYYVSKEGKIGTAAATRYIPGTKTIQGKRYYKGYYHFGKNGKLSTKKGVVRLKNVRIHQQVFNGYYYHTDNGRIYSQSLGLVYLDCKADNGKKFKGYYYRDALSKINNSSTIHNIDRKSGCSKMFPGYHYFGENGRLDTELGSHKLNLTYKGKTYKGWYCFTGPNGQMVRKKGLAFAGDTCYYVTDSNGKCLTGAKKKIKGLSYTFGNNGKGRRTSTKLKNLDSRLKSMTQSYGGHWSVYIKRLDNNDSLTITNTSGFAASLIKAFTMASAYEQIELGNLKETAAIKSLLNSMITVSSNESYNEMVMRQDPGRSFVKGRSIVNDYLKRNGYKKTAVHGTYGSLYISDGKQNCTSVVDCGMLLESIYRGTCVSKDSSRKMLDLLLAQQRRGKIPAGVPAGIKVANKTGENAYSDHDMAIVYSPECTYILCVMTFNCYNAPSKIASVSRTVYNYFN